MITPKTYEPKEPAEVQAVQWTEESQAIEICSWIESGWDEPCGGPTYDPDLSGASGPAGEDWGCLELDTIEIKSEVAPFDYVVWTSAGNFAVVPRERFERSFREVTG